MVDYNILRNLTLANCSRVLCPSLCPIAAFWMASGKVDETTSKQHNANSSRGNCWSAFIYTVRVCVCNNLCFLLVLL